MLWKCCIQYASKFGKLSSSHRTGKGQFSFQSLRKAILECSNYCTIALISHASKVMLKILQAKKKKILQARLQQYVNLELPDVQAGFKKAEEPEIKLPTSAGSSKKQESSRKHIYFCFIDYTKAFDCVDHNKLQNSKRDGNTRPPDLPSEKPVCRSRRSS